MATTLERAAARAATDFAILGRTLECADAPVLLADWLRAHWYFPEHAPTSHPYRIKIAVRAGGPSTRAAGDGTPMPVVAQGVRLPWRIVGREWRLHTHEGGLALGAGAASSRIEVWGSWPANESSPLYLALYVALVELLRASGLLPLHAGACARDGRVTLLLGASGTGKSTSVIRAVRQGWAALAEDAVWLDPATLTVFGWDRGIRLHRDALDRFGGSFRHHTWQCEPDGKLVLGYDQLGPAVLRSGTLSRIAVLARAEGQEPRAEAIAARDLVRALWESTGVPLAADTRAWVARVIPSVFQRVECRRMWLGCGELPL